MPLRLGGPWTSSSMAAGGSWLGWPWGIAWETSGSRANISIAAQPMTARMSPMIPQQIMTPVRIRDSRSSWMESMTCCRTTFLPTCTTTFAPIRSLRRLWGIGVGFARTSLAYRTFWRRTNDPEDITVFDTAGVDW